MFVGSWLGAQTFGTKNLKGVVSAADRDVADVTIFNTTTQKATITDAAGEFGIWVSLNDTLVFASLQYKRKILVVTAAIFSSSYITVPMEEAVNELDEIVLRPYNLSGNIGSDLQTVDIPPPVTAASLGLPNAYVKPLTQNQRKLFEATTGGGILPLNPIINALTGRKKMLKKRVARDEKYGRTQRVRAFFVDSLFTGNLKIPKEKIPDFMYFCEVDTAFAKVVDTHDKLKIWDFLKEKSKAYLKNNGMAAPLPTFPEGRER